METIDVLPTLAAAIGVRPPWETDGENVLAAGRPQRPSKTMFLNQARDRLHGPGDLGAAIAESVAHKLERFETGDPTRPRLGEYDRLVGTPVADLLSDRLAHFEVVVDDLPALRDIDPHADLVPARLMGGIVLRDPQAAVPPLAVAVNGVVAAVTRVYSFAAFGHGPTVGGPRRPGPVAAGRQPRGRVRDPARPGWRGGCCRKGRGSRATGGRST